MDENIRSTGSGFTFVDLFAGIGGFHLALEGLGGRCVLASEIDPDCQSVYRANFPATPVIGDIRELTADTAAIPQHDVLAAGFPCQPFSKSGYQMGLRDQTRGTLFFEIMEVIRARHPRFVVLENVRNIAGPRHADTWRTIILSLREEGYCVADEPVVLSPHLLPPSAGGAPQVRDRVFILAWLSDDPAEPGVPQAPLRREPPPGWTPAQWHIEDVLDDDHQIENISRYRLRAEERLWLDAWNDFIRHLPSEQLPGYPIWVDAFRLRPDTSDSLPDWKIDFHRKNSTLYREHKPWIDRWISYWNVRRFPPSRRKLEWQARGHEPNIWRLVIHFRPSGIRVKPPTYLPALVAITQTSVIGPRGRRITPREAARLQGFPDTFQLHANDAAAYRQLGNAVNVGVARFVTKRLFELGDRPGARRRELRLAS